MRSWERTTRRAVDGVVDAGDIATLRQDVEGGEDPTVATQPATLAPGDRAQIDSNGLAMAPASAPQAVKDIIAAGNVIAHKPYRYGGGHGRWNDSAYDCSGSVSYALHGAKLLNTQLTSGEFESWGEGRRRPVGHDLRQRRPRLHDGRGPAVRYERAVERRHALAHVVALG